MKVEFHLRSFTIKQEIFELYFKFMPETLILLPNASLRSFEFDLIFTAFDVSKNE